MCRIMVYSSYKKTRMLSLAQKGYKSTTIKVLLEKEGQQEEFNIS